MLRKNSSKFKEENVIHWLNAKSLYISCNSSIIIYNTTAIYLAKVST